MEPRQSASLTARKRSGEASESEASGSLRYLLTPLCLVASASCRRPIPRLSHLRDDLINSNRIQSPTPCFTVSPQSIPRV
eukprot:787462-Pleurochrysis_carterae.AAC.3